MKGIPPERVHFVVEKLGQSGGIESVLAALVPALVARGIDVRFVSCKPPLGWPVSREKVLDLGTFRNQTALFPTSRQYPGFLGTRYLAKLALVPVYLAQREFRIRRFFASLNSRDSVIFMDPVHYAFFSRFFEHENNDRKFALYSEFHNSFDSDPRREHDAVIDCMVKDSDAFVALNPAEAQAFAQRYGSPVASILNPLGLERGPHRAEPPHRIVCISRWNEEKRIPWIMKAFDRVADEFPDWELHVYGFGLRAPLDTTWEGLTHPSRVVVHGQLDRVELQEVLDHAALNANASVFEGSPMALVEGAARGVPTVATPSCPAVVDLCEHAGYLSGESFGSYVETMRRALSASATEWTEKSEAARAYSERFSLERTVDDWITLMTTRDPRSIDHADPSQA